VKRFSRANHLVNADDSELPVTRVTKYEEAMRTDLKDTEVPLKQDPNFMQLDEIELSISHYQNKTHYKK
jgi:hypothetical protein